MRRQLSRCYCNNRLPAVINDGKILDTPAIFPFDLTGAIISGMLYFLRGMKKQRMKKSPTYLISYKGFCSLP
jgi:hypothetical protein